MPEFGKHYLFLASLFLAACLFAGCGGPESADDASGVPAATGTEDGGAPGEVTAGVDDALPPAVKMARDDEPGTDLLPGTEKTVTTAEGDVTVKKGDDGAMVDQYDGKDYPR